MKISCFLPPFPYVEGKGCFFSLPAPSTHLAGLQRWLLIACGVASWGLIGGLASLAADAGQDYSASKLRAALKIPGQHPYLLVTRAEVEEARRRAEQSPSAQATLESLVKQARELAAKPLGKLPEKGDTAHWGIAERLVQAGLGHTFSGDPQLAQWVRDGLLAYADVYPSLPLTRMRCKVFSQSSLYEAMWAENIALAYDLVADSGTLNAEQRQHIEQDLLRAAVACFQVTDSERDARIRDLHYRCYNFQAWHLGAIGLIGLAVRDPELVEYAVTSRYGFQHLVAHDIRDDGLFWERSLGYHRFVLAALLPLTEAMFRCGVDLYQVRVPNDRSIDEDCHYVTDTSPEPKSLRMMFQAPFYLAFPDLSYIALGDSDRGPLRPDWMTLVAWNRYREPHLAWLLRQQMAPAVRAGFLHYYRYQYRYEDVRLDGQPIAWGRQDETYKRDGTTILASDQGVSQSDRYLLNSTDLGDFVLEWRMTRLQDVGREERAWVVFRTNPRNAGERRSMMLTGHLPEVGRSYRFRLEVRGEQAKLTRDGQPVSTSPTVYHAASNWRTLVYGQPGLEAATAAADAQATWRDQAIGNTGVFQNGCTLLPSSGVAMLRQHAGDFTAQLGSTAVALSYGPYGGGHGHPDKLSIAVYAQGRQWVPHYGSMPYESHWKTEWTSHTLSHNTLVVDERSQRPAGDKNLMWPVDSSQDRVLGTLERFDADAKLVAARCASAYPGLVLRRQVRLWQHCVVDCLDALPDPDAAPQQVAGEHQFDYVLHVDGQGGDCSVPLQPRSGPLGSKCGYQLVDKVRSAVIDKPAQLTFLAGESRWRLWVLPQESSLEVIVGEAPTNKPDERKPIVVLRQRGAAARFRTVFEPVGEHPLDEKLVAGVSP